MSGLFDLTGQVAMVTGANTGLGQAIAVGLAEAGCDIVAVGRTAPDETAELVAKAGRRLHAIAADFSTTEPVARKSASPAVMSTRVCSMIAGVIWLATNRFQIIA